MLNFCDFIQVYVFSTNHHLKRYLFTIRGAVPGDLLLWEIVRQIQHVRLGGCFDLD